MEEVLERKVMLEGVELFNFTGVKAKPQKIDADEKNVEFIVVAEDNKNFKINSPSYEIKLYGKSLLDWVKSACEREPVVVEAREDADIIKTIKPYLSNSTWTVVLYADTPLLTQDTIAKCFEYVEGRHLNVCKLSRGYIFKTDYVKHVEEVYALENCPIKSNEFARAEDFVSLADLSSVLKKRIVEFHMNNGVQFVDLNNVYIESEVSIGAGTIIYPNNSLYGATEIGEKTQLFAGNRLIGSIIGSDVILENASILNSVVGDKCRIKNSVIGPDCLIKNSCKIVDGASVKEAVIEDECKIMGATVKGSYLNKNCKVYEGARICGKAGNIVLQNNVSVFENAIISKAGEIVEATKVPAGKIVCD